MCADDIIAKRVRFFRVIRDIPYYIATGNEQDYSCATKPVLLDILLKSLGLEVKHILCTFSWEKLGLPKKLLDFPHDPIETHDYLIVHVPENDKWVTLDPTWDSRIEVPNLVIPEWDGVSDAPIAVPIEQVWSPEESERLNAEEDNRSDEERAEYLRKNGTFFKEFNKWLESQRRPI